MKRARGVVLGILLDALLVNAATFLSFFLRFDGSIPQPYIQLFWRTALPVTVIRLLAFWLFGIYRRVWRYASIQEVVYIVGATSVGSTVLVLSNWFGIIFLPRTIHVGSWLLTIALVGASRFSVRVAAEGTLAWRKIGKGVLIVGAGDAGIMVAKELRRQPALRLQPLGFVDDDPHKQGRTISGLRVFGRLTDIPRIVSAIGAEEVIIAMPSASGASIRSVLETCHSCDVRVKTVPGLYELIGGGVTVNQIREVQIEDLLGREPVNVDLAAISGYIEGKVVLITGAGGSIGSELCNQVARFKPELLVLLGHGENSIFEVAAQLRVRHPNCKFEAVIADIKNRDRLERLFEWYRPSVVFHAAAHKHVPLMEKNPEEAFTNNVLGTSNLVDMADKHGVLHFVMISTDKAVNPGNVMGASKRLAEMIVQAKARRSSTRFVSVRFGNVLGSRGSVIPTFRAQILAGGPVTVTHPEMTRYFMTIPEASQLVVQAGAMGRGGEVFILDMGKPVKILDLARDIIRLSGFEPERDIRIEFTGPRPGEKLFEELLYDEESTAATRHEKIFVTRTEPIDEERLALAVQHLNGLIEAGRINELANDLKAVARDFHAATVKLDEIAAARQMRE